MLVPAFVDIHMHGCGGNDAGTCDIDGLTEMCRLLARHGTGAFLPTLPSVSPKVSRKALSVIDAKMKSQSEQLLSDPLLRDSGEIRISEALVLGAHLEGPFMLPEYKGAHEEAVLLPATMDNWKRLTDGYEHVVKRVTIDPLCPGAMSLIPYLTDRGITVTCGHTAADSDTIMEAFRAGATSVTHIFNAMPSIHHRKPGPAAASLADDNTYAELICDFLHVNKTVCKMVVKCKSPDKVAIITDSCEAAGMPDGTYQLSGQEIKVINGEACTKEGKLASSTVFVDIERLNLLSLGFGERDISKLTHYTPINCCSPDITFRKYLSCLYAEIGENGLAKGLIYKK